MSFDLKCKWGLYPLEHQYGVHSYILIQPCKKWWNPPKLVFLQRPNWSSHVTPFSHKSGSGFCKHIMWKWHWNYKVMSHDKLGSAKLFQTLIACFIALRGWGHMGNTLFHLPKPFGNPKTLGNCMSANILFVGLGGGGCGPRGRSFQTLSHELNGGLLNGQYRQVAIAWGSPNDKGIALTSKLVLL